MSSTQPSTTSAVFCGVVRSRRDTPEAIFFDLDGVSIVYPKSLCRERAPEPGDLVMMQAQWEGVWNQSQEIEPRWLASHIKCVSSPNATLTRSDLSCNEPAEVGDRICNDAVTIATEPERNVAEKMFQVNARPQRLPYFNKPQLDGDNRLRGRSSVELDDLKPAPRFTFDKKTIAYRHKPMVTKRAQEGSPEVTVTTERNLKSVAKTSQSVVCASSPSHPKPAAPIRRGGFSVGAPPAEAHLADAHIPSAVEPPSAREDQERARKQKLKEWGFDESQVGAVDDAIPF